MKHNAISRIYNNAQGLVPHPKLDYTLNSSKLCDTSGLDGSTFRYGFWGKFNRIINKSMKTNIIAAGSQGTLFSN